MFSKPLSHFLIGPSPFKRMSIERVVFWPGRFDMFDQRLATVPRAAFQIPVTEGIVEQFCLVEPGGVSRCEAGSPPGLVFKIVGGGGGSMAGVTVLDQKYTRQRAVMVSKLPQGLKVMGGVLGHWESSFHPATMHDQKQQHVDCAMPSICKLLLLDRAGDGSTNRLAFNGLQIRHLINADDPKAAANQALGIGIAPQDLLRALLEQRVQVRCFPIACAMRLQVHLVQNIDGTVPSTTASRAKS
jgi:hypothetical protein